MIATNAAITPDQLLGMPDNKGLEIVGGKLVEKPMGYQSSELAFKLGLILGSFCLAHRLGRMTGADGGFQCFADDPSKVRIPDIAFISFERLPADQVVDGYCKIAPDLAVEVVSPNDRFEEVSAKVQDYLEAGVSRIWVVDPRARQVQVYYSGGGRILTIGDELSGETVLPGFSCAIKDIFSR